MRRFLAIFAIGIIVIVVGYILYIQTKAQNSIPQAQIVGVETPHGSFARATGPIEWDFPLDHGAHTEYQTEWWYYTGNLETEDGRHFGYQLTLFRRALIPDDQMTPRTSNWATNQVYFAHFALSDTSNQRYTFFERTERGAAGIAGATVDPYEVWISDWVIEETDENTYHLHAKQDDILIDLSLEDTKGPILHGNQGYLQKGPDAGNASYYYSLTRLESSGRVEIGGEQFSVEGFSWMDHEFATGSLTQDIVGWDWFCIQLDDGSELMLVQGRLSDGSISPYTSGTLIDKDGSFVPLTHDDFEIEVESTWRSPHTQAEYPARWTVTIPSQDLTLDIEPYMADQEQYRSIIYWEGAVKIEAHRNDQLLTGVGYVELTGYAGGGMGGRF